MFNFFGSAAPAGRVTEITSDSQYRSFLRDNPAAVVDFKAAWCGPCKAVAPVFASLSLKYDNVAFASVDVDALSSVAASAGVSAMPTFVLFKHGAAFKTVVGADMKTLAAGLDELAASVGAVPFSGGGRKLGDAPASAPAAPAASTGPSTLDAAGLDTAAPIMTVHVRRAGTGDRVAVRVNAKHTVGDVAAAVGGGSLVGGFPPAPLDAGATVEAAGIGGSLVTQK